MVGLVHISGHWYRPTLKSKAYSRWWKAPPFQGREKVIWKHSLACNVWFFPVCFKNLESNCLIFFPLNSNFFEILQPLCNNVLLFGSNLCIFSTDIFSLVFEYFICFVTQCYATKMRAVILNGKSWSLEIESHRWKRSQGQETRSQEQNVSWKSS